MAQDRYGRVSAETAPAARAVAAGGASWVRRRAGDAIIILAGIALALPLIVLGG